ncbi:ABC transporter permease [Breznakiella homolactica]|uniref:Iron ABC transporter permease n=1 Tax=Breznakiella homolactica TaxID=2798577 RepID=A0A7T7XKR7_9SPIR|nr:iron ABC transporter permease [Breznakiella homolactica]QQO08067.1 iron ABC transporter permease [Breznakiella homolactica]
MGLRNDRNSGTMKRNFYSGERVISWILALFPLAAVAGVFILPYISALAGGFRGKQLSGDTAGPGTSLLGDPALRRVVAFTLKQAFLSTLLALSLGIPGAVAAGAGRFRGRRILRALTSIPFAMPPILVVLGFVLFFGNAGWLNRIIAAVSGVPEGPLRILYKPSAIVLAHGFYNFPLVIRLAGDGIAQARKAYEPAASSLGASPVRMFATVILPVILPSVVSAALLIFLYSFTSFAVILVLGGGPGATTLSVEIYRYARIALDYQSAGILALAETAIAGLVFLLYLYFDRKAKSAAGNGIELDRGGMDGPNYSGLYKTIIGIYGFCMVMFILGPILSVPLESFLYKPSRTAAPVFSLRYWASMGKNIVPALGRSVILAVLSATAATVLAVLGAAAVAVNSQSRLLRGLIRVATTAPLASSGVVLGLGWLSLYGRDNARSVLAVALIHAVTALPFAYLSVSEGLRSVPGNTLNAAAVFGAGPFKRTLTVAIPISLGRLRSAWGFSAAISLGELNAILMLGMDHWETLPLFIYRAAGSYRYGLACAAGTILILCCIGAFLLSDAETGRKKDHVH